MNVLYQSILKKLAESSIRLDYNAYKVFDWPASIGEEEWMMSRDLMTVHGTPQWEALDEKQLKALSRWESINFYSMTLHGERDLILILTKHIDNGGFLDPSDFFHRFIGEENDHMWFFSEFCRRYGRIYPSRKTELAGAGMRPEIGVLLDFLHILIFEEVGDHFNVRMSADASLPAIVRHLNKVHHDDESRHIAGGRQLAAFLFQELAPTLDAEERAKIEGHLRDFAFYTVQSLYNPEIYRDAGIPEPLRFRRELMRDPARREHHGRFLKRSLEFLKSSGIIQNEETFY